MLHFALLFFSFCISVHAGFVSTNGKDHEINSTLTSTIRATDCIVNSTHCHCVIAAKSPHSQCIKPSIEQSGRCYMGTCAGGYRCDCNADDICKKVSVVYYATESTPTTIEFDCTIGQKDVPKLIVGHTTDFHITAYQEYELYINNQQISYSTTSDYNTFTAEVNVGDIVSVIAKRGTEPEYGVKLRFINSAGETRNIDSNWYASSAYVSSWMDYLFDPVAHGWGTPSVSLTVPDPSFDSSTPFMWYGTADTVYFRYALS